jgi:hypothetical protein
MSWKGLNTFVSLQTSVFISGEYNVTVNSKELNGTTEYLIQQMRCHINRCRYNQVWLYFVFSQSTTIQPRSYSRLDKGAVNNKTLILEQMYQTVSLLNLLKPSGNFTYQQV